jgi:hypothetical protein
MAYMGVRPIDALIPQHRETGPCCCPVCAGIVCLDRPRFFSGQVLSEADLNNLENYVLAKNRLHNRFLHGSGVVCGLEVVCNECDGYITVKPGYAIDSCGNDIIVCKDTPLDVLRAIQECCTKRRRDPCDPYQPADNPECKEIEQHWCITIEYQEKEARGVMPLAQTGCACGCSGKKKSSCGCGCHGGNGNGHAKGNGNGNAKSNGSHMEKKAQCYPPQRPELTATQCEPTRIIESYKLCVIPEPPDHCVSAQPDPNSLFGRILTCAFGTMQKITKGIPPQTLQLILQLVQGNVPPGTTAAALYDACCTFRKLILDLLDADEFNVHCSLQVPSCPAPPPQDPAGVAGGGLSPAYVAAIIDAVRQMFRILVQILKDCFCHAFLPSCGPDPCDDRLILACLTIRDGKIVSICNFTCRRYAGSFPDIFYWLSVFPIIPAIANLIRRLCCEEPGRLERADPNFNFQANNVAGNFAAPVQFASNLMSFLDRFSLENLTNFIRPSAISLPTLVGLPPRQAITTLEQSNITVIQREVQSAAEAPQTIVGNLFAAPGDTVVIYTTPNAVVGFGRYTLAEQVQDLRREVQSLKG